jgi:hypothetical protein
MAPFMVVCRCQLWVQEMESHRFINHFAAMDGDGDEARTEAEVKRILEVRYIGASFWNQIDQKR